MYAFKYICVQIYKKIFSPNMFLPVYTPSLAAFQNWLKHCLPHQVFMKKSINLLYSGELFSFGSFVLSTRNNVLVNSLNYDLCFEDDGFTYVYKIFRILISLILSNVFLCNCLLVFWLATLAFMNPFRFPTIYEQ